MNKHLGYKLKLGDYITILNVNANKNKRSINKKIDWGTVKVSFVPSNSEDINMLNPCSHMSTRQREKEIVKISAKIWRRYCK